MDNVALGGEILQQQQLLRLVGDGCSVGERGVATLAVVPDRDPREDGRPGGARRPGPGIDRFRLRGGEEAFRHGVAEAVAATAHRGGDRPVGEP